MTDLIARLRGCKTSWTMLTALINEAADRIEALQSEVEMWKATAKAVVDFEKVELRAEVGRLQTQTNERGALAIAADTPVGGGVHLGFAPQTHCRGALPQP